MPLPHLHTPSYPLPSHSTGSPEEAAGASDLDVLWGVHPPQLHWSCSPEGLLAPEPHTWALG